MNHYYASIVMLGRLDPLAGDPLRPPHGVLPPGAIHGGDRPPGYYYYYYYCCCYYYYYYYYCYSYSYTYSYS